MPRKPTVTVSSEKLLDSVKALPRHHLGSTLYTPTIRPLPFSSCHESVKFGYESISRPLPRFDGKENCTLTLRVPRFFLQKPEREEICRRRALWGTEVYTDDSDPLAAAIHSGWIAGEWDDDVDIAMLDLDNEGRESSVTKAVQSTTESLMVLNTPPPRPMSPPPNKDLHLTLLILPTLQEYASHVSHGLKSRTWGNSHDGMSFKIENMSWVDEGAGNGEERSGEARRKRLKGLMNLTKMAAGPPFRLNLVERSLSEMKPAAIAA